MKNVWGIGVKIITILIFFFFVFFAFVSFNENSAAYIVGAAANGGEFHEKSVHTFIGLLVLLFYQAFVALLFFLFAKRLDGKNFHRVALIFSGTSAVLCWFIYFYSAVIPWSIPLIR